MEIHAKDALSWPETSHTLSIFLQGVRSAHQVLQHHLIQRGIIPLGYQLSRFAVIKAPSLFQQPQKRPPAIIEMGQPMLHLRWPERMHIKADVLAIFPIA